MKKLKTNIVMILLTVFSIIGAIGPISTANAAGGFSVRRDEYSKNAYKHGLYAKDNSTGKEVVAYCYNSHRVWPNWRGQSATKYSNATNDQFLKLSGKKTPGDGVRGDKNELKNNVMKVCYKGFPRNATDVKERYNLNNDSFRLITQLAVWYYTDSDILQRNVFYTTTYSHLFNDKVVQAYYELIKNDDVTLPEKYQLDLYETSAPDMQNALSTKLPEDYVPPKTIEFSKTGSDLNGAELSGATLQILNKNDNSEVDKWTTDGKTHKVDLFEGEYIFREMTAPNGYDKVSDIYFKVDKQGKVTIISKVNNQDNATAEVKKLTVVDKKKPIQYKSLTVTKEWKLYGHQQNEIPGFVEVQLYENGNQKGNPVKLENSNNWSYTWKDSIDPSKKYEVKEVTTSNNWVSSIKTGNDGNVTIYNSMKPELTVEKIVRGDFANKTTKFKFNINFLDNGQKINDSFDYVIEKNGTPVSKGTLTVNNGLANFEIGHEEKIRIKGLPPEVMYSITEELDGKGTFNAKYKISNNQEQNRCPWVTIGDGQQLNNTVTVYNDYVYIPPTGIDLNNKYIVPVAFLLITGSLLFSAIAILRFRKELK